MKFTNPLKKIDYAKSFNTETKRSEVNLEMSEIQSSFSLGN